MSTKADFTKAQWKKLCDLARAAYERELDIAVGEVVEAVREWQARQINSFELSDRIHEFHNGNARELWKYYNSAKPPFIVAGALAQGILMDADVPKAIRDKLPSATS